MSMTLIEHIELTTTTASIEFTSIPADYTDLFVVASLRNNGSGGGGYLKLNGVLASYRTLYGDGSNATTQAGDLSGVSVPSSFTANTFSNMTLYIPNYTSSNNKSVSFNGVIENNATACVLGLSAASVATGSAVSTLEFYSNDGSLVQYSTATLYGIRKYNTASAPKATGGIIAFDDTNNKWVHTFTASGTFTPSENLSGVEYVVIAGGGGGSTLAGGGGGAGGYRSSVSGESSGGGSAAESSVNLTASTGYTVTIGAGGAGATTDGQNGVAGTNSSFFNITSNGGGYGSHNAGSGGGSGGSGGGAGYGTGSGGSGTSGQGYDGGDSSGTGASNYSCAGGGGAGGAGGNATLSSPGAGGFGVASSITGSSIYRAGGGGGSFGTVGASGGVGGGGDGGGIFSGTERKTGVPGTGGGGGGGRLAASGAGSGGSGVVILRYDA